MSIIILEESYAATNSNKEILEKFIDRLSEAYGGLKITNRQKLQDLEDVDAAEIVHFSNGSQFRVALKRIGNKEVICGAAHEFNYDYLEKLTKEDLSLLCSLAVQRSLKLTLLTRPLEPHEQMEEEQLSYLVPKLMIITGQAKEENFGTSDREGGSCVV